MNIYVVRPRGTNIGNEVIYLSTKQFLKGHNVIRLEDLTAQSIYEVNQCGDGLIVGGGNLYENSDLKVDPNALKALQVPMFLFSLGHGKVYGKHGLSQRTDSMPDDTIRKLNAYAQFSSVRDWKTYEYLKGLNWETVMCGCPSEFISEYDLPLKKVPSKELLFIRNPELMSVTPQKKRAIAREIENQHGLVVCNDKRDIPFAESLNRGYVYFDDVYEYLSYIKHARKIISYRLHATIPALSFGVPIVINKTYDERAESLMASLHKDNLKTIKILFNQFLGVCSDNSRVCSEL